jgi:hypothetical protein
MRPECSIIISERGKTSNKKKEIKKMYEVKFIIYNKVVVVYLPNLVAVDAVKNDSGCTCLSTRWIEPEEFVKES